ncbi:MAG TPA: hypothetical protein VL068_13790, partial [Microthrixaceae bacterium]|nr:hypothetical protein [Microthrixaceae bacterium]
MTRPRGSRGSRQGDSRNGGYRSGRLRFGALAGALAVSIAISGCSSSGNSAEAEDRAKSPTDGESAGDESSSVDLSGVDRVLSADGTKVLANLDPRFQSYNVEMVEVTGGEFWAPYDSDGSKVARPPIELSSVRLRNLARALGPAYIRVSGTWANSTYFDVDGTSGGVAPEGFGGVLTTDQWKGVGDFAEAVDGEIVTSFASHIGVRDAAGVWKGDQAKALMEFSLKNDIPLVAAEFYNEPSINIGVPPGYDIASFGRDFKTFKALAGEVMPKLKIVGPGAVEDVTPLVLKPALPVKEMFDVTGPAFDAFSYHFYPKVSERCGSKEGPEVGLTQEFLSRVEADRDFYKGIRDEYQPGAPMWVTETAQAACGGDRWAAQYLDVIRYVDELGRLADGDGDVVFHNTLAASDYGLIDEDGFKPRPTYWAAVLWQKLMGSKVLAADTGSGTAKTDVADLAVYTHCTPSTKKPSVTYAVVNSSATEQRTVATRTKGARV